MKTIHCIIIAAFVTFAAHAERLVLKYPATVDVLDDSGKRIGTRKLKSGTAIALVAGESKAITCSTSEKRLKQPTGISPAQFLAEKRTTPTSFIAAAELEGDPFCPEARINVKTHWAITMLIFGKTKESCQMVTGYVPKTTPVGKSLFDIMKDGEKHTLLVTVNALPNSEYPDHVKISDFELISNPDPRVKALGF